MIQFFLPTSALFALQEPAASTSQQAPSSASAGEQRFNWHFQSTSVVQGYPGFSAKYSGLHSLSKKAEAKEVYASDVSAGVRLWKGAEVHADLMQWQGFGLSNSVGMEAYPNGQAYKAGAETPNYTMAHLFIRQVFGFGGPKEDVADTFLTLRKKEDVARLTLTLGRMTPLDIFDKNSYAGDSTSQFLNWGLMANLTWDYGQDTIGYGECLVAELNQRSSTFRYGFFPMPPYTNAGNLGSGDGGDNQFLTWPARGHYAPFFKSWSMATEYERRYQVKSQSGTVRWLGWLNQAKMASFHDALTLLNAQGPYSDISSAAAYHFAYGFGVNWEQTISPNVGAFSRLGWNDGKTQALEYSDANWMVSGGLSFDGNAWKRPGDGVGVGAVISGISADNRAFLEAGGVGIMEGDGALTYQPERVAEVYYRWQLGGSAAFTLDYQYAADLGFNQDRGPVSIFGLRFRFAF